MSNFPSRYIDRSLKPSMITRSENPSTTPIQLASELPSSIPSIFPTPIPPHRSSPVPSDIPSMLPSLTPTFEPSFSPSSAFPSTGPSHSPISTPLVPEQTSSGMNSVKYTPGLLNVFEHGLTLSEGLTSKIVAVSGLPVLYQSGTMSTENFLRQPDAAATFPTIDGGWIYVINSEFRPRKHETILPKDMYQGGVGAFRFDASGNVVDYQMILKNMTWANCGGGKTPWGSWISCEEHHQGQIWQVDPAGVRPSQKIFIGKEYPGPFESFACDVRSKQYPRFFVTKDDIYDGELTRFTPDNPDWSDPWNILYGTGTLEYLLLLPVSDSGGVYMWTTDISRGKMNAMAFFPSGEGIDVVNDQLFFVSKLYKTLFILDLDNDTYTNTTTNSGLFGGQPDQIVSLVTSNRTNNDNYVDDGILYFTEDGGGYAGVHGRDVTGNYYTILESSVYSDETTGLAFSPNGMHMYVSYQDIGILFDITRLDGMPFYGKVVNVKYHSMNKPM